MELIKDFILGETLDDINQQYAVFLREAMFKVMYKCDDQSEYTEINSSQWVVQIVIFYWNDSVELPKIIHLIVIIIQFLLII